MQIVCQAKRVTVFGYGACGRGTAACFRNAYSAVSVVDTDPVTTLEAHLDGFETPLREEAIRSADVIITVKGHADILTTDDLHLLKDGVILMNGGNFPQEIAFEEVRKADAIVGTERYPDETIDTLLLADGRRVHILGEGQMAHLAGLRPLGKAIESMDLGFALQASENSRIISVFGRNPDRFSAFGDEFRIKKTYTDIDALLADPSVDVVYVALPSHMHALRVQVETLAFRENAPAPDRASLPQPLPSHRR